MRIDLQRERLLTLEQAAQSLPGGVAASTIWRWHRHGLKGHRLETIVIGGKRLTSAEAVQRFADALTAATEPPSEDGSNATSPGRDETTRRRLEEAGLLK